MSRNTQLGSIFTGIGRSRVKNKKALARAPLQNTPGLAHRRSESERNRLFARHHNQLKHHQCGRGGAGLLPGVRALLLRLGRDDDGRRCDARRASSAALNGDGAGGAVRRRFARASRARPSSWRLSSDSRSRGVPTAPHVISGDSLPPGRIRGVIGTRPSSAAAEVVSDDTDDRSG